MRGRGDIWVRVVVPLLLLASAVAMGFAVKEGIARIPRTAAASDSSVTVIGAAEPIAAEAQVFRTSARILAIDPTPGPRRPAHPRTMVRYKTMRAYPGAPPRIPHGLTPEETHTGGCNTCHERGGYSQRFGAYVPINPHPELVACLQCHVGDATLLAVPLPSTDPSARCRQCHSPTGQRWTDSAVVWRAMAWPQLSSRGAGEAPPPIPHGRHMRENCLACHAAPAAVAEVRTTHPERSNCRQCHVESGAEVGFTRIARDLPAGAQ